MDFHTHRDKNQTLLTKPKRGLYSDKDDGWIARKAYISDHTRFNKAYPDAAASIEFVLHPKNPTLTVSVSESFEMSNGNTRTNEMSLLLTEKNIRVLHEMLTEYLTKRKISENTGGAQ